jgi:hypothetical protein
LVVVSAMALASPANPQNPNDATALEFYGYTKGATPQRAFLREGGAVFIAAEGDLINDRYRLVRIEVDSAVVEDMSSQQRRTLPLAPRMSSNDSSVTPVQKVPNIARAGNPDNMPRPVSADNVSAAVIASRPPETSAVSASGQEPGQVQQYRFRQSHPRKQR